MSKDSDQHEAAQKSTTAPSEDDQGYGSIDDLIRRGEIVIPKEKPEYFFDMGDAMDRLGEEYARKLRDEEE